MSADNWAICPRCEAKRQREFPFDSVETKLREDYEIGMDKDGLWEMNYSCSCKVCGFRRVFKQQQFCEVSH